jgi:hypothetical protein
VSLNSLGARALQQLQQLHQTVHSCVQLVQLLLLLLLLSFSFVSLEYLHVTLSIMAGLLRTSRAASQFHLIRPWLSLERAGLPLSTSKKCYVPKYRPLRASLPGITHFFTLPF